MAMHFSRCVQSYRSPPDYSGVVNQGAKTMTDQTNDRCKPTCTCTDCKCGTKCKCGSDCRCGK